MNKLEEKVKRWTDKQLDMGRVGRPLLIGFPMMLIAGGIDDMRKAWQNNINRDRLKMSAIGLSLALYAGGIVYLKNWSQGRIEANNATYAKEIIKSREQAKLNRQDMIQKRWEEMSEKRANEACLRDEFNASLKARFPGLESKK